MIVDYLIANSRTDESVVNATLPFSVIYVQPKLIEDSRTEAKDKIKKTTSTTEVANRRGINRGDARVEVGAADVLEGREERFSRESPRMESWLRFFIR